MKNTLSAKVCFGVVFLVLLTVGFWLAHKRMVWNDEIYTQISSVHGNSYLDILRGRIEEGSVSPLFYLIQKLICAVLHYTAPSQWWTDMGFDDPSSRVILRINSVFFMSLAVGLIFYFFFCVYSPLAGLYSLLVALSSYMVWAFWAEGRPYALWFFLTTLQSLLYLYMIHQGRASETIWKGLLATHLFLSLTSVFSILQIVAVSFLVWIFLPGLPCPSGRQAAGRKKSWWSFIFLTVVPCILCIYYYIQGPKYPFWFDNGPLELINANIPKDRFILIALFVLFVFLYFYQKKKGLQLIKEEGMKEGIAYFMLTALMLLAAVLVLIKFKLTESSAHQGFQISSRYFIYLTPVGIVAATLFSLNMLKSLQGRRWLQTFLVLIIVFLLVFRIERTFMLIKGYYHL